jgi:Na+/H+ antiporter NhaD/arsenite permease-like protein
MEHELVNNAASTLRTLPWQLIAGGIFVVAYVFIAAEWIHKTKVALAGACLMMVLGIVTHQQAFTETEGTGVSWNTIFLLTGMMIIVNIVKRTGLFQWIAIRSAKLGRGNPFAIAALLSVVTAVLSAFLDNVTTVLLVAPVTFFVAEALGITPVPFLICEIIASNIGGTATLIGDPPNIMIGSAAHLGFLPFVANLTPVIVVILFFYVLTIRWLFRKEFVPQPGAVERVMALDESRAITDAPLLKRSGTVLLLTLSGFVVHGQLHLEPAVVALAGAALLLLVTKVEPHDILQEVEWPTLFFFIGLFIMVTGLVNVGLVELMAKKLLSLTGGNMHAMTYLILWLSAFASAIIDNIPFVATMNPLILDIAKAVAGGDVAAMTWSQVVHAKAIMPLWWALSLGACLGGNGTIIGASANVVVAGISERNGHPISFRHYLKYGAVLMIESVILSHLYLWFRYLR